MIQHRSISMASRSNGSHELLSFHALSVRPNSRDMHNQQVGLATQVFPSCQRGGAIILGIGFQYQLLFRTNSPAATRDKQRGALQSKHLRFKPASSIYRGSIEGQPKNWSWSPIQFLPPLVVAGGSHSVRKWNCHGGKRQSTHRVSRQELVICLREINPPEKKVVNGKRVHNCGGTNDLMYGNEA